MPEAAQPRTLPDTADLVADWPPPYTLAGDAWCFLGLVRRTTLSRAFPDVQPLALFGWSAVLLQAINYREARSPVRNQNHPYSEFSVSAVERRGGRLTLTPLRLLVDSALALRLGQAYGFPKQLTEVRIRARGWSCLALAGDSRTLSAARGPGAWLFSPLRRALAHCTVAVHLLNGGQHTTAFQFRALDRVAPALGLVSPALRYWSLGPLLLPFGLALQGFAFELAAPSAHVEV